MPDLMPSPLTPELLYLASSDATELAEAIAPYRTVDIADALNRMPPEMSVKVLAKLPSDLAVEVLEEPELDCGPTLIQKLGRNVAGPLVDKMSADRRADFLRQLPARRQKQIIDVLEEPTRSRLKTLLKYRPGTAGGIMTTEFLELPSNLSVGEALKQAKTAANDKQTVYVLYVTDAATQALSRTITLQDLLTADPSAPLADIGDRRQSLITQADTPVRDVAHLISKYNLLAIPVVDDKKHLIGVVTVDDMIDEMVRETTEDVQRFGGGEALGKPYLRVSIFDMIRKRAGWLAVLFLGEMLTATAMGHFENEIAHAVVLSLFIPLIISSGGNSGSQATSLIIRAIALQELKLRDWWRVAVRELPSGLALGIVLGVIGMIRVLTWQYIGWYNYGPHVLLIALTMGTALVGVVTFGSLAGAMLPFILSRLGFDPARASAPLVATLVDVTGLIIYFSVAFLILRGTLL